MRDYGPIRAPPSFASLCARGRHVRGTWAPLAVHDVCKVEFAHFRLNLLSNATRLDPAGNSVPTKRRGWVGFEGSPK